MKLNSNYIILKQALRYLTTEEEKKALLNAMSSLVEKKKLFIRNFVKNFDVNKFKDTPLIWQDIWLYNYVIYDTYYKVRRSGGIAKYEKHVFIMDDTEFFAKREFLNKMKI